MPLNTIHSLWGNAQTPLERAIKHGFYNLTNPERSLDSLMVPHESLRGARWVSELVFIGDCELCVPEESLADWISRGEANGIAFDDSDVVGLRYIQENEDIGGLIQVACDHGGNNFFLSPSSGDHYILWHEPEAIERINLRSAAFIDWLIAQYPEQPVGRPWAPFKTVSLENPYSKSYAHADCYPLASLAEQALKVCDFPLVHATQNSFSALKPDAPILVDAHNKHRGFLTHLEFIVSDKYLGDKTHLERAVAFERWLEQQGFRHPDDLSVGGWDGDEDDT